MKKYIIPIVALLAIPAIAFAGFWSNLFGNTEIPIRFGASLMHEIYGGTGMGSYTAGDIIISTSTDDLGRLAIGSATQVLTVSGGVPVWATATGGSGSGGSNWATSSPDRLILHPLDTTHTVVIGGVATTSDWVGQFEVIGNALFDSIISSASSTFLGTLTSAGGFIGALTGNADTATALIANPTDCAANQFAQSIVASGNLTCAAIADADVPNTITVDLATAATALNANGANCAVGEIALGIDASGAVEGCYEPAEADITDLSHYVDADVSTYLVGGTGITETAGTISFDCSEVEGVGINCATEAITLDATGDWTGTLDGLDGNLYSVQHNSSSTFINWAYASSTYVWASDWTTIDNYPSACGAGDYVSAIGDTLTCSTPAGGTDISTATLGEIKDVSTTTLAYGNILAWSAGSSIWNSTSSLDVTTATTTYLAIIDLISCDTIDTDAQGNLKCGTDETGAGGGDPVLVDTISITDASGVDLTSGVGVDIILNAGASPETATFAFDGTEIDAITWSDNANASNVWTFDVSGIDHTMTFGSGLITMSNDLTVSGTLTGTLTGNADTATALAANPTDCTSGDNVADTIAANGALTCTTISATHLTAEDFGDWTCDSAAGGCTIDANVVALTTNTTGNYAAGDAEAGNALTGDTATAFFSAGTIEHEYGGLEANVGAYTGLLAISGGATSEIDLKSEIEAQIADVADFCEADGDVFTGVHDFGGATSLEIPNGAPTVDTAGEIGIDTTSDQLVYYGGAKRVITYFEEKSFTVASSTWQNITPTDIPLWHPYKAITVIEQRCLVTGGTSVVLTLSDGTNSMDAITCGTTLTKDSALSNNTWTADELVEVDFGAVTGAVNYVEYTLIFSYDAD